MSFKKQPFFILCIILLISTLGCSKATDNNTQEEILENVIVDDNTLLILNQTELDKEFTRKNEEIDVDEDSSGINSNAAKNKSFTLTLVGEVASPIINDTTLQATSASLKDNYAFISYNTRGEVFSGALDVVDIKNPSNPKLKSRTLFSNKDINQVYYKSNKIILAEAQESGTSGFNSKITVYDLKKNQPDFDSEKNKVLKSFAGTSVYAQSGKYFATSGSTGSLYYLDKDLESLEENSLTDARWVSGRSSTLSVLQGGDEATLNIYKINKNDLSLTKSIDIEGSKEAEAKSTADISTRYGFIAGNKQGVLIYNLSSGDLIQTLSLPTSDDDTVEISTNDVTIYKDLLFASHGEAGVYVYQNDKSLTSVKKDSDMDLTKVGKLVLGQDISANHVVYKNDMLLVAAGIGGVKILSISNEKEKGEEDDDDDDDD